MKPATFAVLSTVLGFATAAMIFIPPEVGKLALEYIGGASVFGLWVAWALYVTKEMW